MDAYVYQYLVGGLVFIVGLIYSGRQGYIGFSGKGLKNLIMLFAGLAFFMILQGYLQYAPMNSAAPVPYSGDGQKHAGQLGTGLDYAIIAGYFILILVIGTFYGRGQKNTKDFFFGGQRFSWWLIGFSLVATTIGSYSFVKYSRIAYKYGLASSQTYLNDWFWIPLFLFGWLPILYFSRITSIPEYFERRFGGPTRNIVTTLLLLYLVGYVGVNLYTMGSAIHQLMGWHIWLSAAGVAMISLTYVTFGGQTSVIMTDLFQGVMLLAAGLLLLLLGINELGGFDSFWSHLPRGHRQAFPHFNKDPGYSAVGIFWQDAMANSAMFFFLNQGILMRFMAARSVNEGRKAALVVPVLLMPVAAMVVASGGWVGKALEHSGIIPPGIDPDRVFFVAAEYLATPGIFGLIMAALTAALMSTVDTLVTAISAIVVNDVYRPRRPKASEEDLLRMARISAVGVMITGLLLVPVFMSFNSIYSAHGAFTAAVTPPLVVALLLSVFWRRYTRPAAIATLVGGSFAIALSLVVPEIIAPFAHGVDAGEPGDGILAGTKQYKFMRAFFGLAVSAVIGVAVTFVTKPRDPEEIKGLVWGTIKDAIASYKGSPGTEVEGAFTSTQLIQRAEDPFNNEPHLPLALVSPALAEAISAQPGDLLYVNDARAWLGGLRSGHVLIEAIDPNLSDKTLAIGPSLYGTIVTAKRQSAPFKVQKLYG